MKSLKFVVVAGLFALAGCSGMRDSGSSFTTHAESFRIIGIAIPGDDQAAAMALVPTGGHVENVSSTAADWTSIWGFLGNLVGFHCTHVGGTK